MSKDPQRQQRGNVRAAKQDKAHWEAQKAKAKDATSKATFQRGIDRAQREIDRNTK